jgi:hypothetical protein
MKMHVCVDCGFIQERDVKCEACDSTSMKTEEVHDDQILQQEQMLISLENDGEITIPLRYRDVKNIDFMGFELDKEAFPILFDWALKSSWSLQNEINTIFERKFKNKQDQFAMVFWELEQNLSDMSEAEKEKFFKERL